MNTFDSKLTQVVMLLLLVQSNQWEQSGSTKFTLINPLHCPREQSRVVRNILHQVLCQIKSFITVSMQRWHANID